MNDGRRTRMMHPVTGTFVFGVGVVLAMLASGVVIVLIGAVVAGEPGTRPSFETIVGWAQHQLILGTFLMWLFLVPTCRYLGGWLAGFDARAFGLAGGRGRREYVLGLALGGATLLVPALLARLMGGLEAMDTTGISAPTGGTAVAAIVYVVPVLLLAAFGEELVTRGFLLQYWRPTIGPIGALIFSSLVFTLLHAANAHGSVMGWIGVFLAGIWLGLALMTSKSLWFAAGMHAGWNLAVSVVLGLPVSGYELPALVRWQTADSDLARQLLGGGFGPEEGLAFHMSLTVSIAAVLIVGPMLRPAADRPE